MRGLCITHYNSLGKMVAQGKTTWAQLELLGLSSPALSRGRHKKHDQFLSVVKDRLAGAQIISEGCVSIPGIPMAGVELLQLGS